MIFQELSALEEQLRTSEAELSEKSRAYEAQRQQEQDSLHFAKLQLQEMEQQEQVFCLAKPAVTVLTLLLLNFGFALTAYFSSMQ